MLERLIAGVVVIGVLLWGASVLATPSADEPSPPVRDEGEPILLDPPRPAIDPREEPDEEDDEEDDREDRKRKRGKGDD